MLAKGLLERHNEGHEDANVAKDCKAHEAQSLASGESTSVYSLFSCSKGPADDPGLLSTISANRTPSSGFRLFATPTGAAKAAFGGGRGAARLRVRVAWRRWRKDLHRRHRHRTPFHIGEQIPHG